MDQALSLKTGEFISADKASYASSKNLLLVCPECGEPVYFKARETPYVTPFFAHYKELEIVKLAKSCSLRVMGSTFQKASCLLPNISQGQLVDKFQKSFCVELHTMFGKYAESLIDFIKESNFLPLDRRDYKEVINTIENYSAFQDVYLKQLSRSDLTNLAEGLSDVSTFLRSQYGTWVGNFIYQTAYFLACILHPEVLNSNLGKKLFINGKDQAIFVVEPFRIKSYRSYASEILPETSKRNKAIPKISAIIVSLLICKWRDSKATPKLLFVTEHMQPASKTRLASTSEDLHSAITMPSTYGVAREPKSKTEPQAEPTKEELNPIRSWHSPTHSQILSPRLSASTATSKFNQPSKISKSLLPRLSTSRDTTSPFAPENFKYRITEKDAQRIRSLIDRAKTLYKPSRLSNKEELVHWAKTQNSFEAYFMAKFMKIPHYKADFADQTLTEKLQSWLTWAEQEDSRKFSR